MWKRRRQAVGGRPSLPHHVVVSAPVRSLPAGRRSTPRHLPLLLPLFVVLPLHVGRAQDGATTDRKSTRLNSSHGYISYAVFCLKKKKDQNSLMSLQSC